VREEVLIRAARLALQNAPTDDRTHLAEIIRDLYNDPGPDPPVKTRLSVVHSVMYLYNDGTYGVAYDLSDDATVRVLMVGAETDPSL
jgi:hypothetical protein